MIEQEQEPSKEVVAYSLGVSDGQSIQIPEDSTVSFSGTNKGLSQSIYCYVLGSSDAETVTHTVRVVPIKKSGQPSVPESASNVQIVSIARHQFVLIYLK